MPLEQAGIDLQAKGFAEYIRQLDQIDKKQQEIFNATAQKTGKTVDEISKAYKQYQKELDRTITKEKQAARQAEKLAQAQKRAAEKAAEKARISQQKQAQARRGALGQIVGGPIGGAIAAGPQGAAIALAVAVAQELNEFRQESIKLSREQASAEAQLAAALRSTGGASGLTTEELKAHASALQAVTNFGDETVIQAQAQLLTFTSIGEKVFPRATEAALDLATRMDGDLKGAIIQVGKALNDPIQGVSALTRSGVQFTDAQKDQIEQLVKANDLFGAQSIILAELERQFGGSAEAAREADGGNIALANSFGDLQEEVGDVFRIFSATFNTAEAGISIIEGLSKAVQKVQIFFQHAGTGVAAFGSIISQTYDRLATTIGNIGHIIQGEATEPIKTFEQILDEATEVGIQKFEELGRIIDGTFSDTQQQIQQAGDDTEEAANKLEGYIAVLRQAENLQLSFARAAEDAARKLARTNEDIARKQTRQVARLEERQAKDRDKLLKDQTKQLERFETDRRKQIAQAEDEIRRERQEAGEQQKRDQRRLHRELRQAQERFALDQLQSERRFRLSEQRLIAEGDVIGLKELREDFGLQQQEEKENFNLSQRQQKESVREQQKEQTRDLERRLDELKTNLEEQRAELLASFDEQLRQQQIAQQEAQQEQQRAFAEQAEDRAIALAREEEDRQISQQRQLEDLGRSFANQEGITVEGTEAIAAQLEKIFGVEGTADKIITGFTAKTESEFTDLFDDLEKIVKSADLEPSTPPIVTPALGLGVGTQPGRIGGVQEFGEGGVVDGPIGQPQLAVVHGGETVLPTHQQSFQMQAPFIPNQALDVRMSGGFNITGSAQANEEILQQAAAEMTENFRIAVNRLARRN